MSDTQAGQKRGEPRNANISCPLCGPLYAAIIVGDHYEAFVQVSGNTCRIDVEVDGFRQEVHRCGPGIPTDEAQAHALVQEHVKHLGDTIPIADVLITQEARRVEPPD